MPNLCSLLYICIRRIDFTNVSEEALRHLSDMCDPATFGLNNEDVLDESYRSARKLDNSYFQTTFDVECSGLLKVIHFEFLAERHVSRSVRAELYKLNVYGMCHVTGNRPRCLSMSLIYIFFRRAVVLQASQGHTSRGILLRNSCYRLSYATSRRCPGSSPGG